MSYEIVKSIGIHNGKVIVVSADSSLTPRSYNKWECTPLTEINQKEGKVACLKAILMDYWKGNFHGGTTNRFLKAVNYFRMKHPEITWSNTGNTIGVNKWGEEISHTYKEVANILYGYYRLIRKSKQEYVIRLSRELDTYYWYSTPTRYLPVHLDNPPTKFYNRIEVNMTAMRLQNHGKYAEVCRVK